MKTMTDSEYCNYFMKSYIDRVEEVNYSLPVQTLIAYTSFLLKKSKVLTKLALSLKFSKTWWLLYSQHWLGEMKGKEKKTTCFTRTFLIHYPKCNESNYNIKLLKHKTTGINNMFCLFLKNILPSSLQRTIMGATIPSNAAFTQYGSIWICTILETIRPFFTFAV